jgi:uncharacterized C2H2 Zn-finger protein
MPNDQQRIHESSWQPSYAHSPFYQLTSPTGTDTIFGSESLVGSSHSLDIMGISNPYPFVDHTASSLVSPPMALSTSSSSTPGELMIHEACLDDLPALKQCSSVLGLDVAHCLPEQDITSNDSTSSSNLSSPLLSPQCLIFTPVTTSPKPRRQSVKSRHTLPTTPPSPKEYPCDHPGCPLVFAKRFEKKSVEILSYCLHILIRRRKHMNIKHSLRYPCPVESCGRLFGVRRDCERHVADKHPHLSPQEQMFCLVEGCKRSRMGFKKTRKDNLLRHMRKVHKWEEEQVRDAFRV